MVIMQVSYGPPGHRGVTQLMHVGGGDGLDGVDSAREVRKTLYTVGEVISLGVWGWAWYKRKEALKKVAATTSLLFLLGALAER